MCRAPAFLFRPAAGQGGRGEDLKSSFKSSSDTSDSQDSVRSAKAVCHGSVQRLLSHVQRLPSHHCVTLYKKPVSSTCNREKEQIEFTFLKTNHVKKRKCCCVLQTHEKKKLRKRKRHSATHRSEDRKFLHSCARYGVTLMHLAACCTCPGSAFGFLHLFVMYPSVAR